jgi:hypothetical protein
MDNYDIGMFNFYDMSPGKTELLHDKKKFKFRTSEQSSVKVEYHEISSNSLQQGLERDYDVFCLCVNLADEAEKIDAQIRDSVDLISPKGKLIFLVATKADLIPNSELSDKISYLKGLCAGINSTNPVNNIIRLMFITSAKKPLSKKLNLDITNSQKVSLVNKNKPLLQAITEIVLLNMRIAPQAKVCSTPNRRQAQTVEMLKTPAKKKSTPLKCFTIKKSRFFLFSQQIHTTTETMSKLEEFSRWNLIPSEEDQAAYLKAYKDNQSYGLSRLWKSYGSDSLIELNKLYSAALKEGKEIKGKEIVACLETKYKLFLSELLATPSLETFSKKLNGTQAVLLQLVTKYNTGNVSFFGSGVKMGQRTHEIFKNIRKNRNLAKPAKRIVFVPKDKVNVQSPNSSFI